jgi:hypothetical protein
LPGVALETAYSYQLTATGGTGPYTWTLLSSEFYNGPTSGFPSGGVDDGPVPAGYVLPPYTGTHAPTTAGVTISSSGLISGEIGGAPVHAPYATWVEFVVKVTDSLGATATATLAVFYQNGI